MSPQHALARAYREDTGRVLAMLIADLRDFDLAEEALQEALARAARHWPDTGAPTAPAAWLLTTARRIAIDRIRHIGMQRSDVVQATLDALARSTNGSPDHDGAVPDERLRLIFTCCHPALEQKAQVALTLKTLGGLSAREIARAFLTSEDTMNKRLTRAKRKIRDAGIAYAVPERAQLDARLPQVLAVLYLVYTESHSAFEGQTLVRDDLAEEAIRLASLLWRLLPEPEVGGLLALLLLHDVRRPARVDDAGDLVPLEQQDRRLWNRESFARGQALLLKMLARGRPGPYQIQAAISALHGEAATWADTDWEQIAGLFRALNEIAPSPVVELNRAVALCNMGHIGTATAIIAEIADALTDYQPFYAARADLLARHGRIDEAMADLDTAISMTRNATEQRFLCARRAALSSSRKSG